MIAALLLAALAAQTPAVEDFSRGMDEWWVEGGERVWVENGRLHVKADNPKIPGGGVATIWWKRPHPANFRVEFDAHVVESSVQANNINLFFSYADPAGRPLYDSREQRRSADYNLYHKLDGYIVTFLNDNQAEGGRRPDGGTKARVRIRRNPGFRLLNEIFTGRCTAGTTYRLAITKRGGRITVAVDGREVLSAEDPQPLAGGLLGLRTFQTWLWWDNISVTSLE